MEVKGSLTARDVLYELRVFTFVRYDSERGFVGLRTRTRLRLNYLFGLQV